MPNKVPMIPAVKISFQNLRAKARLAIQFLMNCWKEKFSSSSMLLFVGTGFGCIGVNVC